MSPLQSLPLPRKQFFVRRPQKNEWISRARRARSCNQWWTRLTLTKSQMKYRVWKCCSEWRNKSFFSDLRLLCHMVFCSGFYVQSPASVFFYADRRRSEKGFRPNRPDFCLIRANDGAGWWGGYEKHDAMLHGMTWFENLLFATSCVFQFYCDINTSCCSPFLSLACSGEVCVFLAYSNDNAQQYNMVKRIDIRHIFSITHGLDYILIRQNIKSVLFIYVGIRNCCCFIIYVYLMISIQDGRYVKQPDQLKLPFSCAGPLLQLYSAYPAYIALKDLVGVVCSHALVVFWGWVRIATYILCFC